MKQVELAEKLDLTPRQVSGLVAKGMPTHSLKAALFWRSSRLEIRQTKAVRMGGNNGGKGPKNRKPKPEAKTRSKQIAASEKVTEQPSDPNEVFLYRVLEDSTVLICAALIGEMGMSFRNASLTFNIICCCIAEIYSTNDCKCEVYEVPCPTDTGTPAKWRAQMRAEITQKARELKLLNDDCD